jgi:hypothetical protein
MSPLMFWERTEDGRRSEEVTDMERGRRGDGRPNQPVNILIQKVKLILI